MNPRKHLAVSVAMLGLLSSMAAQAHRCGPSEITIRAGECVTWEIVADVAESEPSDYGLPAPPGANASASPGDTSLAGFPFSKYNLGVYRICGLVPGTTSMTAAWFYAPNDAGANCPLSITVVSENGAPAGGADETDSGEDADPVNTFSGELFEYYPPDLRLDGPMPLVFSRYYSSGLLSADGRRGRLGDGWRTNIGMGLSGDSTRVDIDFRYGQRIRFDKVGPDWVLNRPLDGRFQLVEDGGDFVLMDPSDQRHYRFHADGRLKSISDRNGNALTFGYANGGADVVPNSVSDGLGRQLGMTISGLQFYSQITDGTRNTALFTDFNQQLKTVTDATGNVTTFDYLGSDLMTQWTLDEGNVPLVTAWDGAHRVLTQTDAGGGVWSFDYNAPDTTVTDPDGDEVVHTHDAMGRLIGLTNPDLDVETTSYDSSGRRETVTDAIGRSRSMSYAPLSGQIATATDADGNVASYEYQSSSNDGFDYFDLDRISTDDGRSWEFGRDASGNLTSYVEPGGATWNMTVNARGQLLTAQNPLGGTETRTYRADGMLQTRTDASGNTDTYAYDALWRLQSITHEDGSMRSFTRDGMDRLTSMTDERGLTTSMQYDGNGRLVQFTDADSNVRTYGYDNADRVTSITDALSQTTTIAYDLLGRKESETRANGETTSFTYSALGFPATITQSWGGVWTYSHDAVGQLLSVSNGENETTGFEHDGWGRVTAIDWPAGGTTTLDYDELGRLQRQTDAAGRQTDYRYDAAGRLAGIDAGSLGLDTSHNALALLTSVTDPVGGNWSWTYDSAGRLTSSSDPDGDTTTYTHDNRNRYDVITFADGDTDTQSYDAMGHLTRRRGFDGVTTTDIDFSYDDMGRLSGGSGLSLAHDVEGRVTASNGLTINRQPATGRVSSVIYPGGLVVTYSYDAGGLLSQMDDGLGGVTGFSHDAVGRITGMTRPNGVSSSWTYDDNGRTQRVQHGAFVDLQLVRDASGFISSASREQPTHYSVATAVESASVNASFELTSASHDGKGAVTAIDGIGFGRDPFMRASSRTSGGSDALGWDALGHLVAHAAGAADITLAWNYGFAQPAVGTSYSSGTPSWHYVSLPNGRLLYRTNGTQRQYYHFDEIGNALAITDDAGTVIASYGYSPYGRRSEAGSVAGSIIDNPFTWGGEYFVISDTVSRLYVMGARFYDSVSMRFLSRDRSGPWLNPLAFNPYAYAAGNPMYFVDPWGSNPESAQSPSALDYVSEAVNVVSAGGTIQGVVEEAAKANLNAARETTVPLARQLAQGGQSASSARGAFNQAASAQRNAQRAVNQATSRGMKALGNLGNAATFLGGLIEAYKLNGKLNQHESDYSRSVRNALASAETMSENAFRSYKEGNITYEQLRVRLDRIKELLDDRLENEDDLYKLRVAYDGLDSTFSFLMGLAPGGDKLYAGLKWGIGVP
ncbi:MAG: RHS repeat-associated core domain-containing protein [Lysobacteraceae bacterium]